MSSGPDCPGLSRVSSQTTSMRPFGATDIVPNHCQALVPGSSLIRTGELHVDPPFVLRKNLTSRGSLFESRSTEQSRYTLPLVKLADRSTATHAWPSGARSGSVRQRAPSIRRGPQLHRERVWTTAGSSASSDRSTWNSSESESTPLTYRAPSESTVGVPKMGVEGNGMGGSKLCAAVDRACELVREVRADHLPMRCRHGRRRALPVRSMAIHSLSPPYATIVGAPQLMPPSVEMKRCSVNSSSGLLGSHVVQIPGGVRIEDRVTSEHPRLLSVPANDHVRPPSRLHAQPAPGRKSLPTLSNWRQPSAKTRLGAVGSTAMEGSLAASPGMLFPASVHVRLNAHVRPDGRRGGRGPVARRR